MAASELAELADASAVARATLPNGQEMNLIEAAKLPDGKKKTELIGKIKKAYMGLAGRRQNPKMLEWALPLAEKLVANGYNVIPLLSSAASIAPFWYWHGQAYPLNWAEWQMQRNPDAFAVRLGGVVLLDLDRNKPEYPGDAAVEAALGFPLSDLGEPHQINRANGSAHYLFQVSPEIAAKLKNSQDGQLCAAVDVKRGNALCYLKRGKELPHGGVFPPAHELPHLPLSLVNLLMKPEPVARKVQAGEAAPQISEETTRFGRWVLDQEIPQLAAVVSGRTGKLYSTACNLWGHWLGGSIAEHDLIGALESACAANGWMDDYSESEFTRQVDNARAYAETKPPKLPATLRNAPESPDAFEALPPLAESDQVKANKEKAAAKPLPAKLGSVYERKLFPDEVPRLAELNQKYAHVLSGGKYLIVDIGLKNIGGQMLRKLSYIKPSELSGGFTDIDPIRGYVEVITPEGEVVIKKGSKLNLASAWLHWPGHVKYMGGVDFYPNPKNCPHDVFNLFQGWNAKPKAGDVQPWVNHVHEVIASGDPVTAHRIISFFAHMVQKPDYKPTYAIVLRGDKGCGKGSLLAPFRKMLGSHYYQAQGMGQLGRFNGILAGLIMLFIDEAHLTTRQDENTAKEIISESTVSVERKGIDPEEISNFTRVVIASNHDDAIRTGDNERRYDFLDVSGHRIGDVEYFAKLAEWNKNGGAEALLAYLMDYDISDFSPHFVPRSASLEAEMLKGLDPVLSWMWHELSDPKPFNIRAEKHNWEDLSVEELDRLDAFTTGDVQESPLNAGGLTKRFAHEQAARWINDNVREYGKMKRTPKSVQMLVNKEFLSCFGIEGERAGYGKPPHFYFEDMHAARRGFCKRIGVKPETAFPDLPECWEE